MTVTITLLTKEIKKKNIELLVLCILLLKLLSFHPFYIHSAKDYNNCVMIKLSTNKNGPPLRRTEQNR